MHLPIYRRIHGEAIITHNYCRSCELCGGDLMSIVCSFVLLPHDVTNNADTELYYYYQKVSVCVQGHGHEFTHRVTSAKVFSPFKRVTYFMQIFVEYFPANVCFFVACIISLLNVLLLLGIHSALGSHTCHTPECRA